MRAVDFGAGSCSSSLASDGFDRKLDDLLSRVGSGGHSQDINGLRDLTNTLLERISSLDDKFSTLQSSLSSSNSHTNIQLGEVLAAIRKIQADKAEEDMLKALGGGWLRWVQYLGFAILLFCAVFAVNTMWRSRKTAYVGDEGSFVNGSHGRANSISLAMDQAASSMGFRQRGGKKMI